MLQNKRFLRDYVLNKLAIFFPILLFIAFQLWNDVGFPFITYWLVMFFGTFFYSHIENYEFEIEFWVFYVIKPWLNAIFLIWLKRIHLVKLVWIALCYCLFISLPKGTANPKVTFKMSEILIDAEGRVSIKCWVNFLCHFVRQQRL